MPCAPKKALTIGTPMNEVLPTGTTSSSTPVLERLQPNLRAASNTSRIDSNSIPQGASPTTTASLPNCSCGILSRISAGSDT